MHHRIRIVSSLGCLFLGTLLCDCLAETKEQPRPDAGAPPAEAGAPAEGGNPLVPTPPRDAGSEVRADASFPDAGGEADAGRDLDASVVSDASRADASPAVDAGPSGVLDVSFGGTGFVARGNVAAHDGGVLQDVAYAGAVDATGRVLLGGVSWDGQYNNAAILRLDSTGAVDATFGAGGAWWKTGTITGHYDAVYGMALGANGRVLATGQSDNGVINEVVWKLDGKGVLDPSFAGAGFAGRSNTFGNAGYDEGRAVAEGPGGAVFVAGSSHAGNDAIAMVIWKYTSAGVLDTSFGAPNGWVSAQQSAGAPANDFWDAANGVTVDGTGRVIAVGSSYKNANDEGAAVVWRFTSAGAPDTSFNGTGRVVLTNVAKGTPVATTQDSATGVVLDANGNLLVSGGSFVYAPTPMYRGWVVRLTPAGALDATFGAGGVATLEPTAGAGTWSSASGVAVDARGRVLAGGHSRPDYTQSSMTVWRLLPSGMPDASFGAGGAFSMTGTAGGNKDHAFTVHADPMDRPVATGNSNDKMCAWRLTP